MTLPCRPGTEEATCTLLRALAAMPGLTRLSLSLCVSPPPPPGLVVRCCHGCGGAQAGSGPHLTQLDLWQVSFPDKGDDGRALKVHCTPHLRPPDRLPRLTFLPSASPSPHVCGAQPERTFTFSSKVLPNTRLNHASSGQIP